MKKYFPRVSKNLSSSELMRLSVNDVSEEPEEMLLTDPNTDATASDADRDDIKASLLQQDGHRLSQSTKVHGNLDLEIDCLDQIGITDLETATRTEQNTTRFSETESFLHMISRLNEPEGFLESIPETRSTFTPLRNIDQLDPHPNKGCCATCKNEKCVIF